MLLVSELSHLLSVFYQNDSGVFLYIFIHQKI